MRRSMLPAILTAALLSLAATATIAPESTEDSTPVQVSTVAECLIERNRGACVECCKQSGPFPANQCARFCQTPYYPPPGGEPQP